MADAIAKVAKPLLRGRLHKQIKLNLAVAIGLTIVGSAAFEVFYCMARQKTYAEFYKNYDIDKEFNTMRNKGVFDSCGPD